MTRFLIDEDMRRTLAPLIRQAGCSADDVRDVGLAGRSDSDIFAHAQATGATLITGDKGFGDILHLYPAAHHGVILVRVPPELPARIIHREVLRALTDLQGQDLTDTLVTVELGRTRIHRPSPPP